MGRRGSTARTDATLRAERQENLKDAAQLALLAQQLKQEIEKNSALVLPLDTVKKTDEIAKLVKKIHDRLVRN